MISFLLSILALCSVVSASDEAHQQFQTLLAERPAKESLVPKEVLEKVKALLVRPKSEESDTPKKKLTFMSAEVFFFEDHKSLFDHPIKVMTPMGGGTLDLGRILPTGRAKFNVRIGLKGPDKAEVYATKVYFVPKIQRADIKEDHDQQCGQFFDLTSFYKNELSSTSGFETYVTDGIYAFNLVGTFIFVKEEENQILISNVNFVDPRYDQFLCQKSGKI